MATPPPYDPTHWSATDPSTWPQPIPPATLYQPGMVWRITATGVVDGQAVDPGDLLYAIHRPRRFGDGAFGAGMFGSTPAGDWTVADVAFLAWDASQLPPYQPPAPYSGCPFGTTGWWVIVEAWYVDRTGSRTFGQQAFGDAVFGGGIDAGAGWHDITPGFVDVTITRGNNDGAPSVDATDVRLTYYDPEHTRWDLAPPASYFLPYVGAPLRVSFYDPAWRWYPRVSAEIEQIVDAAGAPPRFVTVQAFGHVMDLDRTLVQWQRPAEMASTRFAALLAAAGWRYGSGALIYPTDSRLLADTKPRDVKARDEIDRVALSAGWQFDTDRYGMPRLRVWPVAASADQIHVVDCNDHGDPGVVATTITYTADESQLLNVVTATNDLDPPTVAQAVDASSVAIRGGRDNTLGFPALGLAFVDQAAGDELVRRVLARYSQIVTHVDPIEADTAVDAGWLPVLAALDTGDTYAVTRVHPTRWTLESIAVGADETITPDRYVATISTTTTTPTT